MSSNDDGDDKTMIMAPTIKRQPPPEAVLVCIGPPPDGTSAEINLSTREITFGRGDDHHVVLKIEGVSRNHAKIYPGDGVWGVQDLGSTNGVFVNKSKVEQVWLKPGDIVSIGKAHYKYNLAQAKAPEQQPSSPEIDISDTEKTMIIRPGVKRAAGAAAKSAAAPESTATSVTKPAAAPRAKPSPAPAAAVKGGTSAGMWVLVAVVVIAIGAGAFFALS